MLRTVLVSLVTLLALPAGALAADDTGSSGRPARTARPR